MKSVASVMYLVFLCL